MPARIGSDLPAVADKDSAETFAESDVTLAGSDHAVENESVVIGPGDGVTFTFGSASQNGKSEGGVVINPNGDIESLSLTVTDAPDQTVADDGAEIVDLSDDSTVAQISDQISPGDTITFETTLSGGQDYAVFLRDSAADMGIAISEESVPATSTNVDVVDGWNENGRYTNDQAMTFSEVRVPRTDAAFTVGWPMPADLYAWDVGVYQSAPDGGSINVHVEEYDDGSWTEIAGPIERGERLTADPSNNVRYRVELSRTSVSQDPSLDAIYRRFKL